MGLDIVLGLMILGAAVRGWFRGFVLQAIRLAGLVGAAYAAAPIRDYGRPYVAAYLPTIRPELLDRLLWWTSAVLFYVVVVGLASLVVAMRRRRPFGETEPNRTDQFAGFALGGLKGALAVAFLTAGLQRYAVGRLKGVDWAEEQARGSYALQWDEQYRPAEKVWTSAPVRQFVGHVRRMGLLAPTADGSPPAVETPVQAASTGSPPRLGLGLDLPRPPAVDPRSPDFAREFDRALGEIAGPRE